MCKQSFNANVQITTKEGCQCQVVQATGNAEQQHTCRDAATFWTIEVDAACRSRYSMKVCCGCCRLIYFNHYGWQGHGCYKKDNSTTLHSLKQCLKQCLMATANFLPDYLTSDVVTGAVCMRHTSQHNKLALRKTLLQKGRAT